MKRAAAVAVAMAAFCASNVTNALPIEGVWVHRHSATMMGSEVAAEGPFEDLRTVEIDQDQGSGRVVMRTPDLTPEILALGYQPYDFGFVGSIAGELAIGTSKLFSDVTPVLWHKNVEECPPLSALRFRSERQLELVVAVVLREPCKWTFTSYADHASTQHIVLSFEPLFIVHDVRFLDHPDDGSVGNRITSVTADQHFRVEVEFELPPPAAVYVALTSRSGRRLVSVRPTNKPDVFHSDVMTLVDLESSPQH